MTIGELLTENTNTSLDVTYTITPFLDNSGYIISAFHPAHKKGTTGLGEIYSKFIKKSKGFGLKNLIGYAIMRTGDEYAGKDSVYSEDTQVHPNWQRKGIASKMYQRIANYTNKQVIPSFNLSSEAKNFWKMRHNSPFVPDAILEGKPRGGLTKWFREKWVNIAKKEGGKHPPCGTSGKKRGYAKCVPAKKASSMSAKEKRSAVNRKRSAQRKAGRAGKDSGGTGKRPIRVKTDKD